MRHGGFQDVPAFVQRLLDHNQAGVLDPQEGARGKLDHIQLSQRVATIARVEDSQSVDCGLERALAALLMLGAVV
jgi:hypothetical protein